MVISLAGNLAGRGPEGIEATARGAATSRWEKIIGNRDNCRGED